MVGTQVELPFSETFQSNFRSDRWRHHDDRTQACVRRLRAQNVTARVLQGQTRVWRLQVRAYLNWGKANAEAKTFLDLSYIRNEQYIKFSTNKFRSDFAFTFPFVDTSKPRKVDVTNEVTQAQAYSSLCSTISSQMNPILCLPNLSENSKYPRFGAMQNEIFEAAIFSWLLPPK